MAATDNSVLVVDSLAGIQKGIADSVFDKLSEEVEMEMDAKQDVLEQLWMLFINIADGASEEAAKSEVDFVRLQGLVRVSSQVADNYRYHAGH